MGSTKISFLSMTYLLAMSFATQTRAEFPAEQLVEFVSVLPRGSLGIPVQWLEMESLIGWEKMMLVFGYADNATVCSGLVEIAKSESPDRNFRCLAAN